MAIISKAPRFIAYSLVDAGNDVIATVSVFQDQAGAEEPTGWLREVKKNIASLFSGPPGRTGWRGDGAQNRVDSRGRLAARLFRDIVLAESGIRVKWQPTLTTLDEFIQLTFVR